MLTVKRFMSFTQAKEAWRDLENKTDHYPFQEWWYQEVFVRHFCSQDLVYLLGVFHDNTILAVGGFEKVGNRIIFLGMKQVLGGQDLTDYGDILIDPQLVKVQYSVHDVWDVIMHYFKQQGISVLQLDFVREDSKTFAEFYTMQQKSDKVNISSQEVSPYLIPPKTWDDYLASLPRDERHELKRKMKRFESLEAFHDCTEKSIQDDFENFIRLHRISDLHKEKFMSEDMKRFFWDILTATKEIYTIHFCLLSVKGEKIAAILSIAGQQKMLLYNSGYDPSHAYYSIGLILHAHLIKKSIEKKYKIHDFLRGSERYKYDLGARNMQLYKITITFS